MRSSSLASAASTRTSSAFRFSFARFGNSNSPYQFDMESYGVSGTVSWDFGGAKLTSISAYRWWDWDPANDGDTTGLPAITRAQVVNRLRKFIQEIRFVSQGDRAFNDSLRAVWPDHVESDRGAPVHARPALHQRTQERHVRSARDQRRAHRHPSCGVASAGARDPQQFRARGEFDTRFTDNNLSALLAASYNLTVDVLAYARANGVVLPSKVRYRP